MVCLNKYHNHLLETANYLSLTALPPVVAVQHSLTILGVFLGLFAATHFNTGILLWGKLAGFGGALLLYHFSANQSYFYFCNAGYHIKSIIWIAFAFDIIIYTLLTLILTWSHLF